MLKRLEEGGMKVLGDLMALNYANDTLPGDNPAVSYATVYPLSMFSRVIIAQIILMLFL